MSYLTSIAGLLALASCIAFAPCAATAGDVDVRILIDVSGSMKANDPQNLRIPAVRLVAELMPHGATAGIWTFSERTERLLGASQVDAKWKSAAQQAASRIHSRGLFTDVEAALKAATHDWGAERGDDVERHLILLTDGMVDVSKQAADSAASRHRILGTELAKIQAFGAQVHTIALSANSDRELMTVLAESTEGWAEQVDDAASLQRVFLHMFEQAAAPDAIPLLDNRFEVDGSISEMTLLVFRGKAPQPLQLIDPDGKKIDQSSHPDYINWRAEDGYDLITVGAPATGTWQINTDPDPDNRVLIVTDLKLAVDALPTNVLVDESVTINAHITERGKLLEREDFLTLLQAELVVSGTALPEPLVVPIALNAGQSRFIEKRQIDWQPGDYEFVVRIDGGTFRREQRSKIRIHGAPVTFSSRVTADGVAVEFFARADAELVSLESLAGLVVVAKPDGASEVFDLPSFSSSEVGLTLPTPLNGTYEIEPRIFGESASGRTLSVKTAALRVEITAGADASITPAEPLSEEPPAAAIDWLQTSAIVLIGNALVGVLLGGLWLRLGQRKPIPSNQVVLQ